MLRMWWVLRMWSGFESTVLIYPPPLQHARTDDGGGVQLPSSKGKPEHSDHHAQLQHISGNDTHDGRGPEKKMVAGRQKRHAR